MVVIGNPPYNLGQKNENENNKNRPYPVIDERIRKTYAKDSKAQLTNKLYDAYVKFFRWAVDCLEGRDGIVCFVSNNSFLDQIAFDGMRKHLLQDFTGIYHLDLHGNVRKNPKLSGSTHNVFGIQVGVGITIAVKSSQRDQRTLYYYRVPEFWSRVEKLKFLADKKSFAGIDLVELQPDKQNHWITEGIHPEFLSFFPMGTKEAKGAARVQLKETGAAETLYSQTLFKMYSLAAVPHRYNCSYHFDKSILPQ